MTLAILLAVAFTGRPAGAEWEIGTTPLSFLTILGLSYLTTGLALLADLRRAGRRLRLAIFLLDVPLVTALVHLTGGIDSHFVVLYLFPILTGGIVLADQSGLVLGTASAGTYGLLLVAEAVGWLAPVSYGGADPRSLGSQGGDLGRIGALVVLPLMGVVAGTYGRLLDERQALLQAAAREVDRARLDTEFVLSQLGSGVLSLDEVGHILHFNRAAGQILGLDPFDVIGRPPSVLGAGAGGFVSWIEAASRGKAALTRQVAEVVTPDGRKVPLGMTGSRTGEEGLIVVFQDLTAPMQEEAERARKEKLATIGGLVAGITHEIRNCVKPIAGSLDVLMQEPSFTGQDRRLVELAARECQRLGNFVQALLDYGRVTPLVLEPVDLEDLLKEVGELTQVEGGEGVEVAVEVGPEAAGVAALIDREPLKQVLLNLTQNALEAMGEAGGRLRLILERSGRPDTRHAVVRVIDSGPGVPDELKDRIFEPFFTTKPGGTGFGLAIAAGIVERHGGAIQIGNPPAGEGACFEVHLPELAALAAASEALRKNNPANTWAGSAG
jgi:two-component system sensor histidine kinase PilS (NtrC family)